MNHILPGDPYPLGATWDGEGVNFAIFSEHAEKVELCLFDSPAATKESERIVLPEARDFVWHGYVPGLAPGQIYGYRVHGPFEPQNGHRFNPHKILLDPYTKAIGRQLRWGDDDFGYRIGDPQQDLSLDERDNAASAPLGSVIDPAFDWGNDRPPRRRWRDTVIYETHVKGFTRRHPEVPERLQGTYAGLASEPAIAHLQRLGVTAVELMPVHHFIDDRYLVEQGLSNYWGYNTLGFSAQHWRYRDFTGRELRQAGIELASAFPIYRTYVQAEAGTISESDSACIREAVALARKGARIDPALFDFLADLLLLEHRGPLESDFVMRFQQLTGPAMAKGAEDTACYCFNRLLSLNEVGGNPGQFGLSVEEFHAASAEAQAHWPDSMIVTATHDTKHGEDLRARLSVLSEIPQAWRSAVERWRALNERHRSKNLPGRNMEYHFYQTMVGAWPVSLERALAYMEKAACEAKTRTTWTRRNPIYDRALARFVTGTLGDAQFVADLEAFVAGLAEAGWINSLAQTLIKLTAPGVPDTYQGTELWDLSLVDPDNRRPVDFAVRRRLLNEVPHLKVEEIWRRRDEGMPKLWVMRQALALRHRHSEWFDTHSPYDALQPNGDKAQHVVAFRRGGAITAVPRLLVSLSRPIAGSGDQDGQGTLGVTRVDWGDTGLELPAGTWQNELTGELVQSPFARIADLLAHFPVALLTTRSNSSSRRKEALDSSGEEDRQSLLTSAATREGSG